MSDTLRDQIRGFAQAEDEGAPPLEALAPPGMLDHLGVDRSNVDPRAPRLRRADRVRRVPGWLVGLATAVGVLVVALPLALGTRVDEPAPLSTPPRSLDSVVPLGAAEPALSFDRSTGRLSGTGWQPGATVTATMGDVRLEAEIGADGGFVVGPADFVACCYDELVVTDGVHTVRIDDVPDVEVTRVDPANDVIAGFGWDGSAMEIRIEGGDEPYEVSVFPDDNAWFVDLAGEFDLLPGMVVEVRARYPDITVTHSARERVAPEIRFWLGQDELTGDGFAPFVPLSIVIDGDEIEGNVTTDAMGGFTAELAPVEVSLVPGRVVAVSDGISTVEATVPMLTYDVFDAAAGLASGSTDLPDGTALYLELWMTSTGSVEPDEYATYGTTVASGSWSVSFPPVPEGWTVLQTDVGAAVASGYTVEVTITPGRSG